MKRFIRYTSKPFAVFATILLIAAIGAGGTIAWLMDESKDVKNSFVVPEVTPTIVETFANGVKSNVSVENTVAPDKVGVDVYIRVALIPTWETADRSAIAPITASLSDLNMTMNLGSGGWFQSGNYYYYPLKVAPKASTSILIEKATVNGTSAGAQAGYKMNLQVLAEAIQATEQAVKDAWGDSIWTQLTH